MGTLATVRINTTQQMILYRGFRIEESAEGWEWTHEEYHTNGLSGSADTVFEAIDAVDDWLISNAAEAAE